MTDCKNCKYTDEYCASGECTSQSPRNGSQKGDLTSKWKKGELPEGHYYVKDGENMIAEYLDGYFYNNGEPMTSFSGGVDEILAPVPSYEELQSMNESVNECMAANIKLVEENAQLKELLEKVKDYIPEYETPLDIFVEIEEILK
jgi:hypothetical protein